MATCPGFVAADCWLEEEGDAVVAIGVFESKAHWLDAMRVVAESDVDFDFDERERAPRRVQLPVKRQRVLFRGRRGDRRSISPTPCSDGACAAAMRRVEALVAELAVSKEVPSRNGPIARAPGVPLGLRLRRRIRGPRDGVR